MYRNCTNTAYGMFSRFIKAFEKKLSIKIKQTEHRGHTARALLPDDFIPMVTAPPIKGEERALK